MENLAKDRRQKLQQKKLGNHTVESDQQNEGGKLFEKSKLEQNAEKIEIQLVDQMNEIAQQHQVDLQDLAPKKIDWDLKKEIEPQLQILDKITQKKIVEIVKQRLNDK